MKSHFKNKSPIALLAILLLLCMTKSHAINEERSFSNSASTIQKETSSLPLPKEKPILFSNKTLHKGKTFFQTLNGIVKSIKLQKKQMEKRRLVQRSNKTSKHSRAWGSNISDCLF